MGFFKKIRRKVSRSLRRLRKGKISIGHQIRSQLPKSLRKTFNRWRWSKMVKGRLTGKGNNSALSFTYSGDAPQNGYVYSGRSIGDLM